MVESTPQALKKLPVERNLSLLEDSRAQEQLTERRKKAMGTRAAALHSHVYQTCSSRQETRRDMLAEQEELHSSELRRAKVGIAALENEREEVLGQGHLAMRPHPLIPTTFTSINTRSGWETSKVGEME
ncbi:hypothetical protein DPEC_G00027320 [Dallia pectoralis]|uniref:Uncharacterized protein n=1 Tax=Dallia pectoralis TaxID=75939 RepID=A0ACC2HHQ5_DALPE|nr:hypothetical protein DPEC_G00027320 [Dallia pectoralis]